MQLLREEWMRKRTLVAVAVTIATAGLVAAASATIANIKEYAVGINSGYQTTRLLSVGDTVPETSDPTKQFKMVGIPDGLGAHENANGTVTVFMNHELPFNTSSEPVVGDPLSRGAFVSKLTLASDGTVLSAERAYDTVFLDDTLVGPAAAANNTTRSFTRFCSGSLAGPEHGFDRHIYFANEESSGSSTFDGRGGLAVAIFDNEAHALPALGRFAWENTLVQKGTGDLTVIMGMEDGPASQDPLQGNSQLYLYVGRKDRSSGATVLERNGLTGGTLHVFKSKNASKNSEQAFQNGTLAGDWVALPGAENMSDVELEAASDAAGAMVFARPEDGTFNPRRNNEYFFVTTGGAAGANVLGRLYSLRLNPSDPTKNATLSIVYNADQIVAAGGDIAVSPDNVDASDEYLMVQEDGTAESRPVMAAKGRDGSIWRFDLKSGQGVNASSATRVVELDPPGRDGIAVAPGVWETSGIIDAAHLFGDGTWLFDVQAHGPTTAPASNTVEDGQLLLLTPSG
jgi:hypothetical protein